MGGSILIEFNCRDCGRLMRVAESAAGREGTCKTCNAVVIVPQPDNTLLVPFSVEPIIRNRPAELFIPASGIPRQREFSVSISQKSSGSHSLGLASIILGIIGTMICWIPLVGIIGGGFGLLGVILGMIGFLVSLGRKGSGIGFPIAGVALSAAAIAVAGVINYAILSPILLPAIEQAREAVRRTEIKNNPDDNQKQHKP